jgi:hypothetical protein
MLAKRSNGQFEINGVPQDDRGHHKIESACTMVLRLKAAIAQLTQPIEADRLGKRILEFSFVEASRHALTQILVEKPIKGKKRSFDASKFSQCYNTGRYSL